MAVPAVPLPPALHITHTPPLPTHTHTHTHTSPTCSSKWLVVQECGRIMTVLLRQLKDDIVLGEKGLQRVNEGGGGVCYELLTHTLQL